MLIYIKPLSIFPSLHSDRIFGAIISSISQLYTKDFVEELLEEFKENPPFILSSAFPVIFNENNLNESIRFFPKIIGNWKIEDGEIDLDKRKKFKKVEYIQEKLFFQLLNRGLNETDLINSIDKDYIIKNKLIFEKELLNEVKDKKFKKTVIPNNMVNRLNNSSEQIFYSEGYEYSKLEMGLFFCIKFLNNQEKYEKIIKAAIRFLRDRGFGGDISTGKGQFDYEIIDESNIDGISSHRDNWDNNSSFITLSRFIPSENDLNNIKKADIGKVAYEILSKRGKSSTNELRKRVRFFKEGSTFPSFNEYYGRIINSGTELNPAVEYGFAFPIEIKEEK